MSAGRATRGRAPRDEHGFTLVEMLLAVAILGLGVVTVLGGMMTSITSADVDRSAAVAAGAVRAYAEAVAGDAYSTSATTYPAAGFTAQGGVTTTSSYNGDNLLDAQTLCGSTTRYSQDLHAPLIQVVQISRCGATISW